MSLQFSSYDTLTSHSLCGDFWCQRRESSFEFKIVSEDELIGYLDEGWDLVKELSNGKIVIRRVLDV